MDGPGVVGKGHDIIHAYSNPTRWFEWHRQQKRPSRAPDAASGGRGRGRTERGGGEQVIREHLRARQGDTTQLPNQQHCLQRRETGRGGARALVLPGLPRELSDGSSFCFVALFARSVWGSANDIC